MTLPELIKNMKDKCFREEIILEEVENWLAKNQTPITQRTYSEQDLLDVWDAACDWLIEYNLAVEWGNTDNVDAPEKQQFFKQKFGIEIK